MESPTNLAHAAALSVAVLIEGEEAFGAHKIHGLLGVWEGVLNPDAVVLLHLVKELVRLCIQTPSVQAASMQTQIREHLLPTSCMHQNPDETVLGRAPPETGQMHSICPSKSLRIRGPQSS